MIERDFVRQKKREFQVQQFISSTLKNVGHSYTELQRTPLGDKVIIHTSRPGLIVGRKGQNIGRLTGTLQAEFNLENPQVEISEVEHPDLDARIVAERIASSLEHFGSNRFKGIMHKTLENVLAAGAIGVEIKLSGKLPSSRAKSWRIYGGHLKKCGDAAIVHVRKGRVVAKLKSGVIGIQVDILPPHIIMPDTIRLLGDEAEADAEGENAETDGESGKDKKETGSPEGKSAAGKKEPESVQEKSGKGKKKSGSEGVGTAAGNEDEKSEKTDAPESGSEQEEKKSGSTVQKGNKKEQGEQPEKK